MGAVDLLPVVRPTPAGDSDGRFSSDGPSRAGLPGFVLDTARPAMTPSTVDEQFINPRSDMKAPPAAGAQAVAFVIARGKQLRSTSGSPRTTYPEMWIGLPQILPATVRTRPGLGHAIRESADLEAAAETAPLTWPGAAPVPRSSNAPETSIVRPSIQSPTTSGQRGWRPFEQESPLGSHEFAALGEFIPARSPFSWSASPLPLNLPSAGAAGTESGPPIARAERGRQVAVQREEDATPPAAQADNVPDPDPDEAETAAGQRQGGAEVEGLAREVYAILRRRLAIERERRAGF